MKRLTETDPVGERGAQLSDCGAYRCTASTTVSAQRQLFWPVEG